MTNIALNYASLSVEPIFGILRGHAPFLLPKSEGPRQPMSRDELQFP